MVHATTIKKRWNVSYYVVRNGKNNPRWNGGKSRHMEGYIRISRPEHHRASSGYVYEHILVYEEFHRCCVLPWARIHHINEIKDDNRPENLLLCPNISKHRAIHVEQNRLVINRRKCSVCDSSTTRYRPGQGYDWARSKKTGKWLCNICYNKERFLGGEYLRQYRRRKKLVIFL